MKIVCRCEDITYEDIINAIRAGYKTFEEIKRLYRCGMGICQGRTCMRIIAGIIAKETCKPPSEIFYCTQRPPVRPIPMGLFSNSK